MTPRKLRYELPSDPLVAGILTVFDITGDADGGVDFIFCKRRTTADDLAALRRDYFKAIKTLDQLKTLPQNGGNAQRRKSPVPVSE